MPLYVSRDQLPVQNEVDFSNLLDGIKGGFKILFLQLIFCSGPTLGEAINQPPSLTGQTDFQRNWVVFLAKQILLLLLLLLLPALRLSGLLIALLCDTFYLFLSNWALSLPGLFLQSSFQMQQEEGEEKVAMRILAFSLSLLRVWLPFLLMSLTGEEWANSGVLEKE